MNSELALEFLNLVCDLDLVKKMKELGWWDNKKMWRPLGDIENNFTIVNNQSSTLEGAVTELMTNAIDAVNMKEALVRGINPLSPDAPQSPYAAVEQFFGVKDGMITNLSVRERKPFASDKIVLAADGYMKNSNLIVVDAGEGQTPLNMVKTILSLAKSNKTAVAFMVGAHGQGGSGAVILCGNENTYEGLQIILTKRCPDIPEADDGTKDLWGFTITRKLLASKKTGLKNSQIVYLTNEDGSIMNFEADHLDIIPSEKDGYRPMYYGMYRKFFNFQLKENRSSSIARSGLWYKLSNSLVLPPLPFAVEDIRKDNKDSSNGSMNGLICRLQADIEKGNVTDVVEAAMNVKGTPAKVTTYVFKPVELRQRTGFQDQRGGRDNGILFIQNGQTQGTLSRAFYNKKKVGLGFLKDSLLTIVDLTKLDDSDRERVFKTSRDRMNESEFTEKIIDQLADLLKSNETLRQIQEDRKLEALANSSADDEGIKEAIMESVRKNPEFRRIFGNGVTPVGSGDPEKKETKEPYKGLDEPTFFELIRDKFVEGVKEAQITRNFQVKLRTDASNDFFSRLDNPGEIEVYCPNKLENSFNNYLRDGRLMVSISLPEGAKIGDSYEYKITINDPVTEKTFEEKFTIEVVDYEPGGEHGKKTKTEPAGIDIPIPRFVKRGSWPEFGFDENSGFTLMPIANGGWDLIINEDNKYFQNEVLKYNDDQDKVYKAKTLLGKHLSMLVLGILKEYLGKNDDKAENEKERVLKVAGDASACIHGILLSIFSAE